MSSVTKTDLPEIALLNKYRENGCYTDCYVSNLSGEVLFPDYIFAFYTTFLFKTERAVLKWLLSRPSTDNEARQLADGTADNWAAWTVEARTDNQLLMKDLQGRTRSWFMSETFKRGSGRETRLYFGSAIVPEEHKLSEPVTLGIRALTRFHHLYSVALLSTTTSTLRRKSLGKT